MREPVLRRHPVIDRHHGAAGPLASSRGTARRGCRGRRSPSRRRGSTPAPAGAAPNTAPSGRTRRNGIGPCGPSAERSRTSATSGRSGWVKVRRLRWKRRARRRARGCASAARRAARARPSGAWAWGRAWPGPGRWDERRAGPCQARVAASIADPRPARVGPVPASTRLGAPAAGCARSSAAPCSPARRRVGLVLRGRAAAPLPQGWR